MTTTYEPIELFIEENTVPNFDQLCDDPQALIEHLVSTGQAEPGRIVFDGFQLLDTFRRESFDTGITTHFYTGIRCLQA